MKIRQGFVSNSSTSSYVILGANVEYEDLLKILFKGPKVIEKHPNCKHKFDRENMKFCPECGQEAYWMDNPEYDSEDVQEALDNLGLTGMCAEYSDAWTVGVEIDGWAATKLMEKIPEITDKVKGLTGKDCKVNTIIYGG